MQDEHADVRRLSIDALPFLGKGGISNYVCPLVANLIAANPGNTNIEMFFRLGLGLTCPENLFSHSRISTTRIPNTVLSLSWPRGIMQSFSAKRHGDVFLATTDLVPLCSKATVAWIVYDLAPAKIPQFFGNASSKYILKMRQISSRADVIIAISQATKRDILELLGFPEDRVVVIYPGISHNPKTAQSPSADSSEIERPYICYVGALSLNKNVDGLLRIFAKCVHNHGIRHNLAISGKDFCGATFWNKLARDLKIEDRVHFLGWLTDDKKRSLIQNADMLWQFSWYEGFGLPVLEAASMGIPVLCTNRGGVPEILANKSQEIDPSDEGGTAAKASSLIMSRDILSKLSHDGQQRVQRFSWADSTSKLLSAIAKAKK